MPKLSRPRSDDARFTSLVEISNSHKKDCETGKSLLTERLVSEIDTLIVPYRQTMSDVTSHKHRRAKEVSEKNDSLLTLRHYIRHFLSGLRNRVIREKLPKTLLTLYHLPQSGQLPQLSLSPQLVVTAQKLVQSDESAVEKGYEPMSNPSAEQLAVAIAAAKTEIDGTINIDKELNEVEERLAKHRSSADALIGDVIDELLFNLRKLPSSDQRRVMRNYGFSYSNTSPEMS